MTRFSLTALFISLLFLTTVAQPGKKNNEDPFFQSDSFQAYSSNNADSALYFIRLLAENKKYPTLLNNLLHNSFAQSFQQVWEREAKTPLEKSAHAKRVHISQAILEGMMADSNKTLVNSAQPIYFWRKAQQNVNNNKELIELTNEFIEKELSHDIYDRKVGRYGLLIYQVISKKKELDKLSESLFNTIFQKLKSNQLNVDGLSRPMLERKAWYKYLYAYANFIKANQLLKQDKNKEAGVYLKTAADFSPDLTDQQYKSAYFYDMYFLLEKEKFSFQDDYLSFLTKDSKNNKEALSTLLSMTLANPGYKKRLKSFYDLNFANQQAFSSYWINSINENAKPITNFSLKQIDENVFSTANIKGKWALVDFWGTWCSPCRKEHPDLQQFYQSVAAKDTSKIVVLTVACNDTENKVNAYVKEYNYSFPVAMADDKIENLYHVNSYPTKVLITPQGKYLIVPFGIDWVDFIKKYADL